MKKNLFFVAAAALMLASCSNDVKINENTVPVGSNKQQEIAFAPLAKKAHRKPAAAVSGTEFTSDNMMVTAYNATAAANFFGATAFTYADSKWTGGKYWPLSPATINFLAIANANADNATGVTWGPSETNPTQSVQIVMSDNSSAQRDLMYACGTGTVTQTGNALSFPTNVPMAFIHAQAWIQFKVKAGDAASASAITINSITLNSVSCAGTYTVTHANWNETKATRDAADPAGGKDGSVSGVWSAIADASNIVAVVDGGYAGLPNDDFVNYVTYGDLMVVPNNPGIASFTINYSVDGKAYNYTYTPASTTLAQATKYTYNISLTLHEIEIAPTVTAWTNGGSTEVTL